MSERKVSLVFIITLGILSMLPPLGVDMYLPSFLNIARDLQVNAEQVQHTLTFFTFGMAAGQLFWGPVGDSYGRKPIILLGVLVAAVVAFILTGVNSIQNFTALRFTQGFFGSAPVVLVGALLRDLFDKNELSKMMSIITLIFMIAPLLAPIIGGYIVKFFHWHMIFYVICMMGLLSALLVLLVIPETHRRENRIPLRLNIVARNFVTLWQQKEVLGYMLSSGLGFGGIFAFLTAGSIVYIGLYGVPVDQFGYFFMLNIAMMTISSMANGRFVQKVGAERMLRIGLVVQCCAGLFLISVAWFDLGFWPMALGVALFVGPNPLISSNAMASILEKFPHMAGTANSIAGSTRFGLGATVGSLVALMKMDTAKPMLLTMGTCTILAISCYYFLTYRHASGK
ncbi:Bcr/CflA family multidrug efflux MFS transporter [Bisgaard Taxon 10/6]|uniref:Bcr/CflA family efflux transporter n=1 Tax=Exercitatus varius TaxID=67857 RepID=A0ABT6EP44_9PAST|nr:Bcr/CflA family multidrug efflux MFS transporter [Exercitatus varius]QOF67135.1 Bcr/CflA family multidrug efflux MFS transporter [Actinobacillus sp. GY-402]MDG2915466.1 Bcr/CflA family multidrug efflux MFS transporter [Exercitatus varius]MDG2940020.1 Bcr/CflA family multidrug efflux MFS transporter [Exercitatus varius]MDG2945309.1 Bcr/CflA family multidrug efflux MFS transporter [Exercitatus varius]MDG2952173.1 Bcr/CflA family multidrug efflux MFS transporter [Exercitatus varius]